MKNIILFPMALSLAVMSLASACHDDKGNYDYIELDEVSITEPEGGTGDEYGDYTVDLGDNLYIDPEVIYNGKVVKSEADAPLSYMWTIYPSGAGLGITNFTDTLSTSRVLDVPLTQPGGTYYVQLTVTHNNTGLETYFRTTCVINVSMTAGWVVLYEPAANPGMTEYGLVINPLSKAGMNIAEKEFWNLNTTNTGAPLAGNPISIHHLTAPLASNGMTKIATDLEMMSCSAADMSIVYNLGDLFYSGTVEGPIQYWGPSQRSNNDCEVLIANNRVYTKNSTGMSSAKLYFNVPKISDEDLGELAPWASSRLAMMESVFYSQTKSAFYYTIQNDANIYSFIPQDMSSCQFDVNNLNGAKMLFADWSSGMMPMQNYDYFLFADGNKRYVAEANFTTTGSMPNLGLTYADVTNATDIQNATSFAVTPGSRYIYYSAGNKLYTCAYENNAKTDCVWTAPGNEVITCVRNHKYYAAQMHALFLKNAGNAIHIATWDESAQKGHLYQFFINAGSGAILTDQTSYEYVVPGKVKDMGWKFQMGG